MPRGKDGSEGWHRKGLDEVSPLAGWHRKGLDEVRVSVASESGHGHGGDTTACRCQDTGQQRGPLLKAVFPPGCFGLTVSARLSVAVAECTPGPLDRFFRV